MNTLDKTTDEVLRLAAEHFKVQRAELSPDDDFFKKLNDSIKDRNDVVAKYNDVVARLNQLLSSTNAAGK